MKLEVVVVLNVLKLIASIGIIGVSSYLGYVKSQKLKDREYILRDMVTFLEMVRNEISYMLSYLPNAYEVARQNLNTRLKEVIGNIVVDMLNKDYSNEVVFASISNNLSQLSELSEYDKSVFSSILNSLGKSDLDSQLNIIENSIKILENQIKEANETKLANSKMYRVVGTIAGIMIVVIFI